MRTFLLLLTFFIASELSAQNCTAMNEQQFRQRLNTVSAQSTDNYKLNKAYVQFKGKCLSSYQVKRAAEVFSMDAVRYEFCMVVSDNVSDPENFYDVYDAFSTLSFVMRLHDHFHGVALGTPSNGSPETSSSSSSTANVTFPALAYPSHAGQYESKGCNYPMDNNAFMNYAAEVNKISGDMAKYNHMKGRMASHCLSMGQTMKLSTLISDQNIRLQLMQDLIMSVYDRENYEHGTKVFDQEDKKVRWTTYCEYLMTDEDGGEDGGNQSGISLGNLETVDASELASSCSTSEEDYKSIKKSIDDKTFGDKMLKQVEYFSTRRCFSVKQVKGIMQLFSFDKDKVEAAKMLYKKCTNKDDYYKLTDVLTFSSYKEDLTDFLDTQRD